MMIDISKLGRQLGHSITDNSTAILTAVGAAGTVATATLASKASFRAADILSKASPEYELTDYLTFREKTKLVWRLYVPAIGTGVMTISCIVLANRVGTRRVAALATAYTVSERTLVEFKDKVTEKLGETKAQELRDEFAQDRVTRDAVKQVPVIIESSGKVLCHDAYSGRFWECTVQQIKKAVNEINRQIQQEDSATISDFYDKVGLKHTSISDEFGWNNAEMLELEWSTTETPDERPAMSYDFASRPFLRPWNSVSFR